MSDITPHDTYDPSEDQPITNGATDGAERERADVFRADSSAPSDKLSDEASTASPSPAPTPDEADATDPTAEQPAEDPYEGATPPGYDEWPTHGGYLGCLMGVVLAFVLAPIGYIVFGLIGSALFPSLGYAGVWLAGAITVIAYLACFVGLARLGWRLGKRFYREYPQPARHGAPAVDASAEKSVDAPIEGAAQAPHAR